MIPWLSLTDIMSAKMFTSFRKTRFLIGQTIRNCNARCAWCDFVRIIRAFGLFIANMTVLLHVLMLSTFQQTKANFNYNHLSSSCTLMVKLQWGQAITRFVMQNRLQFPPEKPRQKTSSAISRNRAFWIYILGMDEVIISLEMHIRVWVCFIHQQ